MRDIKFRAWNKVEKKMVYYDKDCSSPDMTLNGVLIAHRDRSNVSYVYDLMQFTGLKDKNGAGKDVYGDDLYKRGEDGSIWRIGWNDYYKPLKFTGRWDLFDPYDETNCVSWDTELDVGLIGEVIGNIHQNPELLNGRPAKEIK